MPDFMIDYWIKDYDVREENDFVSFHQEDLSDTFPKKWFIKFFYSQIFKGRSGNFRQFLCVQCEENKLIEYEKVHEVEVWSFVSNVFVLSDKHKLQFFNEETGMVFGHSRHIV